MNSSPTFRDAAQQAIELRSLGRGVMRQLSTGSISSNGMFIRGSVRLLSPTSGVRISWLS